MKKYLKNLSILIFLLICQVSISIIFPSLRLIPDFILIFVVVRAIIYGAQDAMILGASGGLLQDVFLNSFLGLFTPVKTAISFLAALLSGRFFSRKFIDSTFDCLFSHYNSWIYLFTLKRKLFIYSWLSTFS